MIWPFASLSQILLIKVAIECCSVLERLDEQIAAEGNLSDKSKLKKLARRLRSVHGELKEYSELLQRCISLHSTVAKAS